MLVGGEFLELFKDSAEQVAWISEEGRLVGALILEVVAIKGLLEDGQEYEADAGTHPRIFALDDSEDGVFEFSDVSKFVIELLSLDDPLHRLQGIDQNRSWLRSPL